MDKKHIYIASGVAAVLVLVVLALLFALHQKNEQMIEMEEVMTFEKEQLQDEYQQLAIQFDGYQTVELRNDSLADLLSREQLRVQNLMEELRITKVTNARRIAELKRELSTVREVMRSYVAQIDSLNRTNARLTEENRQYRQDFQKVSDEAKDLRRERTELKRVVTRASMLEVSRFVFTPLNKHDRKTRVMSHICKFQFDYTLAKNVACSTGLKMVYIRVVDPRGELLANDSLTFRFENADLLYSSAHEVEYEGDVLSDTQYLPIRSDLTKGLYNADFFVDGQMIASFPFEVK